MRAKQLALETWHNYTHICALPGSAMRSLNVSVFVTNYDDVDLLQNTYIFGWHSSRASV